MEKKKKDARELGTNPYILAAVGAVLLGAALLMRSFPVLIFAAIAPLFAITDHANEKNFWHRVELVAGAFAVGLTCRFGLQEPLVMTVVLESLAIGLVFLAYTYSKRGLGIRLGKVSLILFWLALEYVLLKFFSRKPVFFLADALSGKFEWLAWTNSTGYLGASLWILIANWLLYLGLFKNGLRIPFLFLFLIVILSPIFYSYNLRTEYATREGMLQLYMGNPTFANGYSNTGEWIPRTGAWISILIFLSALVKDNIRKK